GLRVRRGLSRSQDAVSVTSQTPEDAVVTWSLACVDCTAAYHGLDRRYRCDCGGTLDVVHDLDRQTNTFDLGTFDARRLGRSNIDRSGVWRFRELILPVPERFVAARPEGNTNLYDCPRIAADIGLDALQLKHEGENPTGSFKDRGMTCGMTIA